MERLPRFGKKQSITHRQIENKSQIEDVVQRQKYFQNLLNEMKKAPTPKKSHRPKQDSYNSIVKRYKKNIEKSVEKMKSARLPEPKPVPVAQTGRTQAAQEEITVVT